MRRYDRMEGVSEQLGVFSESSFGSFLCEKGVSNCEKVPSDARGSTCRPGIDVARAWHVPGMIHANMHWSSGFGSTPALISSQLLDLLRLRLVTDHE